MENNEIEILEETNKKKGSKRPYVVAIVLALALVVTITATSYAYFSANISGTSRETVVTTTSLEIEFTDGAAVSLQNAIPGQYIEKTFKVENKGNGDTTYDVYMSELINDFEDKTDLVYTLTSNDGGYNVSTNTQIPSSSSKIVNSQLLRAGEAHNYTLRISFLETNDNQDDNKGKQFSTIIRVNEVQNAIPYDVLSGDLDTIGSVVKIANEEFYVIGQEDSTHVKLLSKWNLKVGDIYSIPEGGSRLRKTGSYTSADLGYGLQSEEAKGLTADPSPLKGSVPFTNDEHDNYWDYEEGNGNYKTKPEYGNYTYDRQTGSYYDSSNNKAYPYVYTNAKENGEYLAPIAEYVDNYVTYLTNRGANVSGRLISRDELISLGCNASTGYCDSNNGGTASEWVYQTSYSTGSTEAGGGAFIGYSILGVATFNAKIDDLNNLVYSHSNSELGGLYSFGVRPVIILEK